MESFFYYLECQPLIIRSSPRQVSRSDEGGKQEYRNHLKRQQIPGHYIHTDVFHHVFMACDPVSGGNRFVPPGHITPVHRRNHLEQDREHGQCQQYGGKSPCPEKTRSRTFPPTDI